MMMINESYNNCQMFQLKKNLMVRGEMQ